MNICIAGKNNIAVDVCHYVVTHFHQANIYAVINKVDDSNDGWQKSYLGYVIKNPKVKLVSLDYLYDIPDLIFISAEFDRIINPLRFRTKSLYNIHFSLLPKYKGVYTSVWPILNHDRYSGVTLHKIDNGIDTGDIIAQKKIIVGKNDTSYDLYHKYIKYGTALVIKYLNNLISGNLKCFPQESSGSTYFSRQSIDYKNLKINLNSTADQIAAQIRAFYFPSYQIPQVYGRYIIKTKITSKKSDKRPGFILSETESRMEISTIDYNIVLYKL